LGGVCSPPLIIFSKVIRHKKTMLTRDYIKKEKPEEEEEEVETAEESEWDEDI